MMEDLKRKSLLPGVYLQVPKHFEMHHINFFLVSLLEQILQLREKSPEGTE